MLKNKFSEYKKGRNSNGWYKWKRNPFLFDFIIMYTQRGHGKRSSFFLTLLLVVGLDHNHNKLVPVGKSYSGFTNDELKKLDKWVRSNIVERFGPVRSVKPGLVIEVAFDNINFHHVISQVYHLGFLDFTELDGINQFKMFVY